MGIIGFLFWCLVPFVLCVLIIPKYLAANANYRADYDNPVLIRHIFVALCPAIVPLISWFAVVIFIVLYITEYKSIFKNSWLDIEFSNLFKKKVSEK